jgi:hypothetical protein
LVSNYSGAAVAPDGANLEQHLASLSSGVLHVSTTSLPLGAAGVVYAAPPLSASGGNPPYTWSIVSGSLPEGLRLKKANGVVSGRPGRRDSGTFTFTVRVLDKKTRKTKGHPSTQDSATATLEITISS